eukprot:Nk52_evm1s2269 gene=Nk52_evmTU1s2269
MSGGGEEKKKIKWLPLEANPEVWNKYIWSLGVPDHFYFTDVYGLDPELLSMVPQPVLAVLLLFPFSPAHKEHEKSAAVRDKTVSVHAPPPNNNLFFMKQTISNACGTMGIIHGVANNTHNPAASRGEGMIHLKTDSPLGVFLNRAWGTTGDKEEEGLALKRARLLEEAEEISNAHSSSANQGQTEAPPLDEVADLHFTCFVEVDGVLYEFDGHHEGPLRHGRVGEGEGVLGGNCLEASVSVIKEFINRNPGDVNFNMIALTCG